MIRCSDHTTIVMRYFEHDYFKVCGEIQLHLPTQCPSSYRSYQTQDYLFRMDVGETQRYMFALLRALYRLHADNIMHRDIKPSNFLANENRSDFLLVDFGLAERWVGDFCVAHSHLHIFIQSGSFFPQSPAAYQNELARLVKLKRF
jgi:serine/threonine protein kinase